MNVNKIEFIFSYLNAHILQQQLSQGTLHCKKNTQVKYVWRETKPTS